MNINTIDLLDWLSTDDRPTPATVATCLRLGLPDLTELEAPGAATIQFADEAKALLATRKPGHPPLNFTNFVATLTAVGHEIFLEESENIGDWLMVLDHSKHQHENWSAYGISTQTFYQLNKDGQRPFRREGWKDRSAPDIIRGFRAFGRGPSYAHEILDRALAAGVAPDMFGYSARITPEAFTELTEAGITLADDLRAYELAGCDLPQAIGLATDGVASGVALAASLTGIDRAEWVPRLVGFPAKWFPIGSDYSDEKRYDPISRGLLGAGFTWEQIDELHRNGWGKDFSTTTLNLHFRDVKPEFFVEASSVCSFAALESYKDALESGSSKRDAHRGMPPLAWGKTWVMLLPIIKDLVAAKVSPSGLPVYRAAGCRTVEEVLQAASLGITAPVARKLVKEFGETPNKWSPQRIESFRKLVRAFGEKATV